MDGAWEFYGVKIRLVNTGADNAYEVIVEAEVEALVVELIQFDGGSKLRQELRHVARIELSDRGADEEV